MVPLHEQTIYLAKRTSPSSGVRWEMVHHSELKHGEQVRVYKLDNVYELEVTRTFKKVETDVDNS